MCLRQFLWWLLLLIYIVPVITIWILRLHGGFRAEEEKAERNAHAS